MDVLGRTLRLPHTHTHARCLGRICFTGGGSAAQTCTGALSATHLTFAAQTQRHMASANIELAVTHSSITFGEPSRTDAHFVRVEEHCAMTKRSTIRGHDLCLSVS